MSYLVNDVFPAGIVLPYAGSTAPAGWLLCDGTSYIRDDYLRLFNAIGTAHGSNALNTFNVPDYRGRFLRGTDNMGSGAAGRDPNTATRTVANAGGNTGNNVGSVQDVATKTPTTAFNINKNQWNSDQIAHSHGGWQVDVLAGAIGANRTTLIHPITGTRESTTTANSNWNSANATVTGGGDAETRPLNAYVNYIIKI